MRGSTVSGCYADLREAKEAVLKSGALNHTMRQRQRLWERIKSPLLRLFGFDVKNPNHVLELVLDL
jgi:hypothetical protein